MEWPLKKAGGGEARVPKGEEGGKGARRNSGSGQSRCRASNKRERYPQTSTAGNRVIRLAVHGYQVP